MWRCCGVVVLRWCGGAGGGAGGVVWRCCGGVVVALKAIPARAKGGV